MASRSPSLKRPRAKSGSSSWNRSSIIEHGVREIGYTVDTADLLFTPERDYLVKNNGHKVRVDQLEGKSIVLFIFPLGPRFTRTGDALDMIQVYNELSPKGDVEFVFMPVNPPRPADEFLDPLFKSQEDIFQHLFSTLPFPAIPLSDIEDFDGPVMKTFGLDESLARKMPYWVVIDPKGTVVFNRLRYPLLFKLFGGAELHPLTHGRISSAIEEHQCLSRQALINSWDRLLASPGRDYLLSCNGNSTVPISSLKGKVIGLYFCDNVPCPPSMQLINKVYDGAKLHGFDFEIVQINLPWDSFQERYPSSNPELVRCPAGVSWLTLPFKDPSCRKLLRIFPSEVFEDYYGTWGGDSLVIIDASLPDVATVPFELSGVEILGRWGIEGYPFTRPSLFDTEYKVQKRDVTLQSLFPPGECLRLPTGQLADASELLLRKNVLVLFSDHTEGNFRQGRFVSMLESVYRTQENLPEKDKFEVVYLSTNRTVSSPLYGAGKPSYLEFMEGLLWLAHPITHPHPQGLHYLNRVFRGYLGYYPAAAAFDWQGELIAKEDSLDQTWEGKSVFPFISRDLGSYVQQEVASCFELEWES